MDFEQAHALNAAIRAIGIRHRALAGSLLAPLGLHTGQEVLLLELAEQGPQTQRQLATASGCEPPTITNSVRKLEDAGLVVRRPSTTDQRSTIVELSDRGEELVPRLKEAWKQLADQAVAGMASTSLDDLANIVADLAASLTATNAAVNRPPSTPRS